MKRKITAIAMILISVISIVLVLTKTPISDIENFYDEQSKYLDYYIFSYKVTKSREILNHIIDRYSSKGDNYDKLKPIFDDVFEIRDEFSQDTLVVNAFTFTDYDYISFLLSNGKLDEADKYCDGCFSKGEYEMIHGLLHTTWLFSTNDDVKNFAFEKLKALVESDMYQSSIEGKLETANMLETGKLSAWTEYAHLLFRKGEYSSLLSEVEKMANNKENGYFLIFSTLDFIEESDDENKNELTEKAIDILVSSDCASDEEIQRIKEYFKIEQK